jgi:hypothetical protein
MVGTVTPIFRVDLAILPRPRDFRLTSVLLLHILVVHVYQTLLLLPVIPFADRIGPYSHKMLFHIHQHYGGTETPYTQMGKPKVFWQPAMLDYHSMTPRVARHG